MYDPEGVWKRRGILAGVLVLVLLLGAGIGALAFGGGTPTNEASNTPSDPNGPSDGGPGEEDPNADSSSRCGLPDGDQDVPSIGPEAQWTSVDDLLTPRTEEFGPGEESLNIHSCFARNPTGALIALANHFGDGNNVGVDQVEFARTRFAPVEGYDANLQEHENGTAVDEPAGSPAQFAGFRFNDYDQDVARIDLAFEFTDLELTEGVQFVSLTIEQRWIDGDWLVVLPESGDFAQTVPQDLSQYVIWAAEPTPLDDEEFDEGDTSEDGAEIGGNAAAPAPGSGVGVPETLVGGFGTAAPVIAASDEQDPGAECDNALSCIGAGIGAVSPGAGAVIDGGSAAAGSAAGAVAGSALEEIATSAREAAEFAIEELLTAWLAYPDPNVSGANSVTGWLQTNLSGLVVFVVVGSVIVSAIRLVTTQRFEHMRDLGSHLIRVLLVAGLTTVVVTLGLEVGDETARFLLDQAEVDLNSGAGALVGFAGLSNPILVILVALVILLTQIVQLALMVIRGAVVIIAAGALPFLAATSTTAAGKQAYQKAIGWLTAFVLYKPVAALIYAVAIRMTNGDQDIATQFSGLGLMILAIIALPALLRAVVPATGALGGTSGGGLVMAGMGAAVATGAVMASGGTAAAAGAGAGGVSGAPVGASALGGGSGGSSGGSGGGPGGSRGVVGGGAGGTGGESGSSQPSLQPVGSSASRGAGQSGQAGDAGAAAPRHDDSGTPAGGGAGAGTPARGAAVPRGGSESLRGFGGAAGGAARGAQSGGGAARAAGGAVGPGGADGAGDDQDGTR